MNQNDQIVDAFNYFFCNIGHNLDKNLMISYQMLNSLCQMVLIKQLRAVSQECFGLNPDWLLVMR
jgi:hypothetical protein